MSLRLMPRVDACLLFGLRVPTRWEWVAAALADPVATLVDHAHCEMKAATTALMMAARYAHLPSIADAMLALARQEIAHYETVAAELRRRGRHPEPHGADRYAKALRANVRGVEPHRLLDLLLVCSIVDARSCERFGLLAEQTLDHALKDIWSEFATCEAGHHALFVGLAETIAMKADVVARLAALLEVEAHVLGSLPCEARIHG